MVREYIDRKVNVEKVLDILAAKNYGPANLTAFLKSGIMAELNREDIFTDLCCIGYLLQQREDLGDGQRQKILADYLRYRNVQ